MSHLMLGFGHADNCDANIDVSVTDVDITCCSNCIYAGQQIVNHACGSGLAGVEQEPHTHQNQPEAVAFQHVSSTSSNKQK